MASGAIAGHARPRKADGTWRKVEVKIARKDARNLRHRARPGYFAPYKQAARP